MVIIVTVFEKLAKFSIPILLTYMPPKRCVEVTSLYIFNIACIYF